MSEMCDGYGSSRMIHHTLYADISSVGRARKESSCRFVQQTNLHSKHVVTGSSPVYPLLVFMPTHVDTKQLLPGSPNIPSSPGYFFRTLAQLVEHMIHTHMVGCSIQPRATIESIRLSLLRHER